jgi:hypothetical protein
MESDNDNAPFPLEQWFDMSRRISKDDRELCEAQMALYAHKEGLEPKGPEWNATVKSLRKAVKAHNAKF